MFRGGGGFQGQKKKSERVVFVVVVGAFRVFVFCLQQSPSVPSKYGRSSDRLPRQTCISRVFLVSRPKKKIRKVPEKDAARLANENGLLSKASSSSSLAVKEKNLALSSFSLYLGDDVVVVRHVSLARSATVNLGAIEVLAEGRAHVAFFRPGQQKTGLSKKGAERKRKKNRPAIEESEKSYKAQRRLSSDGLVADGEQPPLVVVVFFFLFSSALAPVPDDDDVVAGCTGGASSIFSPSSFSPPPPRGELCGRVFPEGSQRPLDAAAAASAPAPAVRVLGRELGGLAPSRADGGGGGSSSSRRAVPAPAATSTSASSDAADAKPCCAPGGPRRLHRQSRPPRRLEPHDPVLVHHDAGALEDHGAGVVRWRRGSAAARGAAVGLALPSFPLVLLLPRRRRRHRRGAPRRRRRGPDPKHDVDVVDPRARHGLARRRRGANPIHRRRIIGRPAIQPRVRLDRRLHPAPQRRQVKAHHVAQRDDAAKPRPDGAPPHVDALGVGEHALGLRRGARVRAQRRPLVPEREDPGVQGAGVAGADELADAADDDAAAVDDLDAAVVERDGEEGGERGEVALAPLLEAVCGVFEFFFFFLKEREARLKKKSEFFLSLRFFFLSPPLKRIFNLYLLRRSLPRES